MNRTKTLFGIFFLLMSHISCFSKLNPPAPPTLLALINGFAIKEDDLRYRLQLERSNYSDKTFKDAHPFQNLKKEILQRMIQNHAMMDMGLKQGIALTPEELAIGIEKLKQGYSQRSFEAMLEEKNVSYPQWRDLAVEQLTVEKILKEMLYTQVGVRQKEVSAYYQDHIKDFEQDEQVLVRHLITDTNEKALELRRRILEGEQFAKVAIMHSLSPDRANGGELGYFSRGTYPKEFDEACFKLEIGELSGVIKSPYGYHLFKLIDRKPKRLQPLGEVELQIEAQLKKIKLAEKYPAWLEEVMHKSQIQVYEENLEKMKME